MKRITKILAAGLLMASMTMGAEQWNSNGSYDVGDTVTHHGVTYVAVGNPYIGEDLTRSSKWEAIGFTGESFNVDFAGMYGTENKVEMDREGVSLFYRNPTGGFANTEITTYSVSMETAVTGDSAKVNLDSKNLEFSSKAFGNTGPIVNNTKITSAGITTSGDITLGSGPSLGSVTTVSQSGVDINSSFGSVKIDDHGVKTDKMVEAGNVISGGVNLNQKIAELEARLAELEAAK